MESDPNNPELLISAANDVEAAAVVAALAASGVEATATGGYTAGFRGEAPGDVQVMVRQVDLERARQIVAEIGQGQAEVDWSQVDVGVPDDEPGP